MAANCYISVGSNMGNRLLNIKKALKLLGSNKGVVIKKRSPLYETKAVGPQPQGDFLNGAIEIETMLSADDLLSLLKSIELAIGRQKDKVRWGPRPVDLDILFYDNVIRQDTNLKIPHPLLAEREFVLRPLSDIAADFLHPVFNKTVGQLYKDLKVKEQ